MSVVLGLLEDCACRALDLAIIEETLSDPPLERRGLGVFVGLGEDATGFGVGFGEAVGVGVGVGFAAEVGAGDGVEAGEDDLLMRVVG
tara:strand:+ start:340 stop:603 length:264 start_codon:yes stop_codon:yes gene_type:complete